MLATGHFDKSNRWKEAKEVDSLVRNKYKTDNITQSGHSLGGQVAYQLGKKHNEKSIGYNPAIGYAWNRGEALDRISCSGANRPEWCSKVHTIRNSTDAVSGLAGGIGTSKVAESKDGALTAHYLKNLYTNEDNITRNNQDQS
jgi:hypothetical protein